MQVDANVKGTPMLAAYIQMCNDSHELSNTAFKDMMSFNDFENLINNSKDVINKDNSRDLPEHLKVVNAGMMQISSNVKNFGEEYMNNVVSIEKKAYNLGLMGNNYDFFKPAIKSYADNVPNTNNYSEKNKTYNFIG